jgi:hypothetical protein
LGDASTGQLFKKTIAELQAAIGGAVISVNGLVGTVVLDTDDIQELATPTNKYFTDARARASISLTTTGTSGASTYSNSTGVLNVPTYTLAGLGGITATFLSGASGIAYNSTTGVITYTGTVFTDASIRALVSAGAGLSYNSSTGVFTNTAPDQTVAIAGGTGISVTGTYPSFTVAFTGTIYTDSSIRGLFSGTAPITYNSSTGAIGITQATTSTNGYLSSTDWNTFNGKQSALTIGNLTEATSSVLTITGGTGAVIGSGTSIQVKQASSTVSGFLSSTDWSTFNSKQGTITLTTTGTSGAATFSGGTLNIPQYQAALTNPVTGTGTSGKLVKFTGTSSIGDSIVTESGTNISIAGNLTVSRSNTSGRIDNNPFLRLVNTGTSTLSQSVDIVMRWQDGTYNGTGGISMVRESATARSGSLILQPINSSGDNVSAMTLTSDGKIGIGITSPVGAASDDLVTQIYNSVGGGSASRAMIRLTNSFSGSTWGNGSWLSIDSGLDLYVANSEAANMYLQTSGTTRMSISSEGTVTCTHSVRALAFSVVQDSSFRGGLFSYKAISGGGSDYGTTIFAEGGTGNGNIYFCPGGSATIQGVITTGGNWLLGTTTNNGERLYVSGSIRATGSITANSDVRLKKNIERIENALQKVSEISGYTYNTIYDEDRHAGVIAQEIDKVLPEIVNKGNDGLMGVEYGNISALLIEAIKDLKVQNDSLQARLSALEK